MSPSEKQIKHWMRRIDSSTLSADSFFAAHDVPFSRAQYFRYKKLLNDRYEFKVPPMRGGNRKIGEREEIYLKALLRQGPMPSVGELRTLLKNDLQTEVGPLAIRRALIRLFPIRPRAHVGRPSKHWPKSSTNSLGGFELIIALAYQLKWPSRVAEVIDVAVKEMKGKKRDRRQVRRDVEGRGEGGRFTGDYNARSDVQTGRFASVSATRMRKNWDSMNVMHDDPAVYRRKSLALLSLPIVTNNGGIRSVDAALGEALTHLCGFNYTQATISKFLCELKYLGLADRLLRDLPAFWKEIWGEEVTRAAGPVVFYYVDGNVKALWAKRVKQSKVTMLGRVMGCLESVFIHDGLGHPLYFETYAGHAPVGEYVLSMFEKIEAVLQEVPGSKGTACRAIVMDSASNSVKTLRAFAAQGKYHYITSLDDNQISPRKLRKRSYPVRYRYGAATLRDTSIELTDSQDNKYLIAPRAIVIEWDRGKTTTLITSIPKELVDASEIVWAYFQRWPAQEMIFRRMKAAVCLNRVCGYGKKLVTNERVKEEIKELEAKRARLEPAAFEAIGEIQEHEQAIIKLIPREYRLRQKTTIKDGVRHVPARIREEFAEVTAKIRKHDKAKKALEKEHRKVLRPYRETMKEWLRLQHKTEVYQVDVELDQIMTYFRASLGHLCAFFIKHYLDGQPMAMAMLFYRMGQLSANVDVTRHERTVTLNRNRKDKPLMKLLEPAIEKLNAQRIRGHGGRVYRFTLAG